jgi:hypothetical protein
MWSIPANRRSISAIGIKPLSRRFNRSDRHEESSPKSRPETGTEKEEGTKMKKFGFATIIASGLAGAIIGLAGPAQADSIHHDWIYQIQPQVSVPHVDTSVHQSH